MITPKNSLENASGIWIASASAEAVERAAELLMTSKKPVILSGGGVRYSDAGAAVLAFAEEFGIPVAETQAGKGEVSCESDWYLAALASAARCLPT